MQMPLQDTDENVNTNHLFSQNNNNTQGSLASVIIPSVLLAVQPLYLKVWVEVEDDALRRLRRGDDPAAALVRRVLQRVAGRGDVAGVAGVQVASARLGRWMGIGRETRLVSVASGSSTLRLNVLS